MTQPTGNAAAATVAGTATTSSCWNCHQSLQQGSASCLWCGVTQQHERPAMLVAPTGEPPTARALSGGSPVGGPPVGGPPAEGTPSASGIGGGAFNEHRKASQTSHAAAATAVLPEGFRGSASNAGQRMLSLTIDVIFAALVVAAATYLTDSLVMGGLALGEVMLGLWVLQARTGLTIGHAILRLRVSQSNTPYSPGAGRSFVRVGLTGIGFLVAGLGAWVVVASGRWDPQKQNRAWPDRVTRTIVVRVLPRPRDSEMPRGFEKTEEAEQNHSERLPHQVIAASAKVATAQVAHKAPATHNLVPLAPPQIINIASRPIAIDEDSIGASVTGLGKLDAKPLGAVSQLAHPTERKPLSYDEAGATHGDGESDAASSAMQPTLLLIFDTGQRDQMATPVAVNIGRNPVISEPRDRLLIVTDTESTVSKTHLRLEHSRGRTWVTDGGSTNGTDVITDDGETTTLRAGERILLDDGARVRIGNRTFTINLVLGSENKS